MKKLIATMILGAFILSATVGCGGTTSAPKGSTEAKKEGDKAK